MLGKKRRNLKMITLEAIGPMAGKGEDERGRKGASFLEAGRSCRRRENPSPVEDSVTDSPSGGKKDMKSRG